MTCDDIEYPVFQSTLPRRERLRTLQSRWQEWRFQSTLPRRERRLEGFKLDLNKDFNPRSREGSDDGDVIASIHCCDFNPRSREGSDSQYFKISIVKPISIHAPAKGATVIELEYDCLKKFQSTLPRRERHNRSDN